jgi:hypothetical protein
MIIITGAQVLVVPPVVRADSGLHSSLQEQVNKVCSDRQYTCTTGTVVLVLGSSLVLLVVIVLVLPAVLPVEPVSTTSTVVPGTSTVLVLV